MADENKPDTRNRFLVGGGALKIIFVKPVPREITKDDALNLAAWLVALADDDGKFQPLLEAVQNT